jgi:glycosyltransferase involved in cell wall biosynthesis
MHIIHVITGLTVGGAQQLLLGLCVETMALGHHVRVIGLRPGEMADEFRRQGIPVDELSMKRSVCPTTLVQLTLRLNRLRPDIVHTHLGRADNYGRVAALMARVPVIVSTVHNVERWKEGIALRLIDSGTSRIADRLIACSGRVAEHLRELKTVPMDKVIIVRNGIRLRDWFEPPAAASVAAVRRELQTDSQAFPIGVVGRLELQKGHPCLFHALASIQEEVPHLRLWIVGEGTQLPVLQKLAADLQIASKITFCGVRRDMREVYAAADLVVMPSLWEGLPIALLEAMAAQRPVIATSVGGIPEVIQHEVNGLLVPPQDSQALAAAIHRCYCNRDFARRLGQSAAHAVRHDFSIERHAQKIMAVYRQRNL